MCTFFSYRPFNFQVEKFIRVEKGQFKLNYSIEKLLIEKIPSDLISVTYLQNYLTLYEGNFLMVVEKKIQELDPGAQTTSKFLKFG